MPGFRKSGHIYGDSGKLRHISSRDTDHPMTIYGDSGKLRRIVFVTLTIQRPYMADLGYYRELSCHSRTCTVWYSLFIVYTRKMTIQLPFIIPVILIDAKKAMHH